MSGDQAAGNVDQVRMLRLLGNTLKFLLVRSNPILPAVQSRPHAPVSRGGKGSPAAVIEDFRVDQAVNPVSQSVMMHL
jgi:hypothetical protein